MSRLCIDALVDPLRHKLRPERRAKPLKQGAHHMARGVKWLPSPMKKTTLKSPLKLMRETIATLTAKELGDVQGGNVIPSNCNAAQPCSGQPNMSQTCRGL
jgi:hypothetical protein